MYGLAKLANDFSAVATSPKIAPAGKTKDADQPVAKDQIQLTTAHLQALDVVDDGYRLFRLMNR